MTATLLLSFFVTTRYFYSANCACVAASRAKATYITCKGELFTLPAAFYRKRA
jgi:hypothetical protein